MPKKIFITGATGFIGSNLVRKLSKLRDDLTILVYDNSTHPFLEGVKLKIKKG